MPNILYSNDRPGQYPDSYYAATLSAPVPPQPALQGDHTCDVCVIGAGYTGLSAALHLAQQGRQVIVLDAHRVGWGASGRNGGQLGTGFNQDQVQLEQTLGQQHAHALWDLSLDAIQLCKTLIDQYDIDCDWRYGIIHADHRARFVPETQNYVDRMQRDYQHEQMYFLDKNQIRDLIGSDFYHGGSLDLAAAHIHPLNFVQGLAQAVLKAGVSIYEHSAVLHYEKGPHVVIQLAQGNVKAKQLILACNGYLDQLDHQVAARVMPINNFIVATEPLSNEMKQDIISKPYAVADSKFVVNYYRLSADNRLLFGGGENYSYQFPSDIKAFVRPHLLKIFPQLGDVKLDYGWGGTLAITPKRMPYFGQLSHNVLSVSGYSGHGVALSVMAGKILADTLSGNAAQFRLLQQVPNFSFPGGRFLRQPLLVLAMLYYSLRDRL